MRISSAFCLILCTMVLGLVGAADVYPFGDKVDGETINYGRSRPMDIQHLTLDLAVDVEAAHIEGTATITLAPVGAALEEVVLDAVDLDVDTVKDAGGNSLEFETTSDKLKIFPSAPLAADRSTTLTIAYSVTDPKVGMHFRNPQKGYSQEETQAWSQGEAEDHRHWFPCFDYPNERSTTEVVATVSDRFIAISNGTLLETTHDAAKGTKTFHWRQDQPHAAYLVNLVVGPYVRLDDTSGPVPLHFYCLPGQEDMARLTFAKTNDVMRFFQDTIGVNYPWDRYGQVTVVDFIAGGMENTTLTTLTDRSLHNEKSLLTGNSNSLIAHELAHQWFGDLVTCRDWSHLWLNEGFATYFDALYVEHDLGRDAYVDELLGNAVGYRSMDKGENRLATVRRTYGSPDDLFDRRVYEKGGWILHMLRCKLGDELFFKGIRRYVEDNFNEGVETNDFMRALEDVSGIGLERFFDQWVYHGGYPHLAVTYEWNQTEKEAKVVVKQTHEVDETTGLFHFRTQLRFAFDEGEHVEPVEISQAEHTFEIALESRPVYVRFDPEHAVLAELDFKKSKAMLLAQLHADPDLGGRYQAIDQLSKMNGKEVVAALDRTLREGKFWGERVRAARALGNLDHPEALQALLRARYEPDARVRRAVVAALPSQGGSAAEDALIHALMNDESPYVVSDAIGGLARIRCVRAIPRIADCLGRESHNETIRSAALNALARMESVAHLDAAIAYTSEEAPRVSRRSAIAAVGAMGKAMKDKSRARRALENLLASKSERTRSAALEALATLGDLDAIPAVEILAETVKDEAEQKRARDTLEKLNASREQSAEVRALRGRVEELERERKELEARLEKIEERLGEEKAQ